ncbi:aromatic ring-hydroxylating dioxygenase subunit alpha [uncultured Paraglaciecola sp.]|uniref:aromatic ring-hydroxylating oxygenase subunit alpha n=1 Tax=uncultured Paraglaciecola sp. TaxID=1765024 RepID=UPI002601CF18|nr:aromatic ring-hydroxylating dioxygenase subunit alpha [uncultured Paraglaciecola sp.]
MAQSKNDKIKQLLAEQPSGFSLAQSFYKDADIYQTEIDNLFLKHWLYAGHLSQLAKAGDYFTFEFDSESVIVLLTASGDVKAHMNVCRHRGSKICLTSSGNQKSLTCPYHAWSYNLDGELISARNMPEDFEPAENGLHQVKVELLGGLIFVCLHDNPPSLSALRRDLSPCIPLFGLNSMKLAAHKSYVIPANWKLAVENYQECYHCAPSHQEFAKVHAMAKSPQVFKTAKDKFKQANQGNPKFATFDCYFDLAEDGQEGYQYDRNPLLRHAVSGSADGKAVAPLLGAITEYDGGASELMIGPLSYFLIYDDYMVAYRFLPRSIDECVCDVSWFVNKRAIEGKDYQLEQLTWLWDVTTQADKTIIMNNQKGVDSRFYQPGRLSEMETFQQSFLNWYLQALVK